MSITRPSVNAEAFVDGLGLYRAVTVVGACHQPFRGGGTQHICFIDNEHIRPSVNAKAFVDGLDLYRAVTVVGAYLHLYEGTQVLNTYASQEVSILQRSVRTSN